MPGRRAAGHRRPEGILRAAGSLLGLAACIWLVAWSFAPGGVAAPAAVLMGLAVAAFALILLRLGWRRSQRRAPRRRLRGMLSGYQESALLYVAARLGVADLLADGPLTSAELAQSVGAHPPTLHRLLRGFVLLGICSEQPDGRFALGPQGAYLRADTRGSVRGGAILCGEEDYRAWGGLLHSVRTGEVAFNHVFGMTLWEHHRRHRELADYFDAGFREGASRATAAVVAAYDFSAFGTVADVGGGHGALLVAILKACPSIAGILFDQPQVLAEAGPSLEAAGVADRCRLVAGSFLESVPRGADLHVLKSIIHNWPDEQAIAILRNCRAALNEGGKLLIVDRTMSERAEDDPDTVWMDLRMLALFGGQERTEDEYGFLLADAGLKLTRVIPTKSRFRIIEAERGPDE